MRNTRFPRGGFHPYLPRLGRRRLRPTLHPAIYAPHARRVRPAAVVEAPVIVVIELVPESRNRARLGILLELDDSAADVRLDRLLPHEERLIAIVDNDPAGYVAVVFSY